jgi:hypothetical protein
MEFIATRFHLGSGNAITPTPQQVKSAESGYLTPVELKFSWDGRLITPKDRSYLDYKTHIWVSYHPAKQAGRGEVETTWADTNKSKFETSTTLAHNYILNMDFQGEGIWVTTAQGLSHGIRAPQKEAQPYASIRTNRSGGEIAQAHLEEGR